MSCEILDLMKQRLQIMPRIGVKYFSLNTIIIKKFQQAKDRQLNENCAVIKKQRTLQNKGVAGMNKKI